MMVNLSSAIGMKGFAQENNSETKYDDKFFEELKITAVEEELLGAGISIDKNLEFEEILETLQSTSRKSALSLTLMKNIKCETSENYVREYK